MSQPEKRDEFDAIRAHAKEINRLFGGKMEINEWTTIDGDVLKIVLTWKKGATVAITTGSNSKTFCAPLTAGTTVLHR